MEGHGSTELCVDGQNPRQWQRRSDGHQVEHDDLFAALRAGRPYNEVDATAASTMTAILGRMATYSGRVVEWDEAMASEVSLMPEHYAWDAPPPVLPDAHGRYAIPVPGSTRVL